METLIINKASKKDLNLLIDIARKIGIDVVIAPKKEKAIQKVSKQKLIAELSKNANKALFNKYVKPVLDDKYNR